MQSNEYLIRHFAANFRFDRGGTSRVAECEGEDEDICNMKEEWVHVAQTFSKSLGGGTTYFNGVEVASSPNKSGLIDLVEGGCMLLGQEADAFCGDFEEYQALDAVIDEWRIWSTVRTAEEVAANYQLSVDPADPNLWMYLTMNLDTVNEQFVLDISSQKNDGIHLFVMLVLMSVLFV